MSDYKIPTKEQYKELDELMTYILDEMWGTDDKQMIREGIIAYANKWHETQAKGQQENTSNCTMHGVSGSAFSDWDDVFGILAWAFKQLPGGEMSLDSDAAFKNLNKIFEIKRR